MALGDVPAIKWGSGFANTWDIAYPLDFANHGSEPRKGSERAVSPSGVEDAWIVGTEEVLEGEIRAIPVANVTETNGNAATGWDGATGVKAALEWLLDGNIGRFIPAKGTPSTFVPFYIVEPTRAMAGREDGNPNRRRLRITFRSSDGTAFSGF